MPEADYEVSRAKLHNHRHTQHGTISEDDVPNLNSTRGRQLQILASFSQAENIKAPTSTNLNIPHKPTIAVSDGLFLHQYFSHIINFLPKSVRLVVSSGLDLPALREATVAFSAARFAYSLGNPCQAPSKNLSPLFIQSLNHFGRAIQLVKKDTSQIEDILAAVIFFILFENVVGTVRTSYCHLRGLETLILRHQRALSGTPYGRQVLRASLFIRAKGFLILGPLHATHRSQVAERELDLLARRICAPQELLFLTMANSIRVSSILLLQRCSQSRCDDLESFHLKLSTPGDGEGCLSGCNHSESEVYRKLEDLRQYVDLLFAQSNSLYNAFLRCTGHPIFQRTDLSYAEDAILPITFDSREDAIACAMYALVQVYCDRQTLRNLLLAEAGEMSFPLTRWAKVILGIAKGWDPSRYLYEETYNMNIGWIVELLCLRWPNADILTYLTQNLVPGLRLARPAMEDTAGALVLFDLVMEMLKIETARGRKVFAMHLVHEDSSEETGFFLPNQSLHFAIHGYTDGGEFFNDYISPST
ncbi:Fungal transcriptional regulatory protein [Aspergillus affinis]|uniref:Fungal transcriptional regulatory protein n=1 Tax=Aspergillus affinis TaxID=1070780 RepID=UPI0022FF35C4|nr:Fungal transcriptional regulatory protein [Aspergillus affinis]KAI9034777.1 Fungal transcriptional regulatory protein [Aspergillus affinis]